MHKNISSESITQEKLKEILRYDPKSGNFTWLKLRNGVKKNMSAGSKHPSGYIHIKIDRKRYTAHRLAWLYIHGYFPENIIDHINRNPSDNRIDNLRVVSVVCNIRNAGMLKNNKSGVKGVHWNKQCRKWYSKIKPYARQIYLGSFNDISDAVMARWQAEKKYGFPNCNTSSSSYNYLKNHGLI